MSAWGVRWIIFLENVHLLLKTRRASAVVEVDRRERPQIEIYPDERQIAVKGGSALFQCRMLAGIPTPTLRWIRIDRNGLEVSLTPSIELLPGGVIRINEVVGDEEGTYRCTATNNVG